MENENSATLDVSELKKQFAHWDSKHRAIEARLAKSPETVQNRDKAVAASGYYNGRKKALQELLHLLGTDVGSRATSTAPASGALVTYPASANPAEPPATRDAIRAARNSAKYEKFTMQQATPVPHTETEYEAYLREQRGLPPTEEEEQFTKDSISEDEELQMFIAKHSYKGMDLNAQDEPEGMPQTSAEQDYGDDDEEE